MSGCLCGTVPRAETLSPNKGRDAGVMRKQSTDEAVVAVKQETEEDMVTY